MNGSVKIPRWKKCLSYLWDQRLESASSDINPHLHVLLSNGKIQLCTSNAIYSYEDRYDNFRLLFDRMDLSVYGFKKVLLLGLGLGSVPLLLEKANLFMDSMLLVELDEMVVSLAEKYILPRIISPYTVICTDALSFTSATMERFDLVISDVFIDDVIPDDLKSLEYLRNLKRLLNPNGMLIYNCLASTNKDKLGSQTFFDQTFSKVFLDSRLYHVWQNYMLIGRP